MLQLSGERGRPEGSVTADVDAPQENHDCHSRTGPERQGFAART
jgi:hypothetical protein